jgi:hypothetical protein
MLYFFIGGQFFIPLICLGLGRFFLFFFQVFSPCTAFCPIYPNIWNHLNENGEQIFLDIQIQMEILIKLQRFQYVKIPNKILRNF